MTIPTVKQFDDRWPRFFKAFNSEEFSPDDFTRGERTVIADVGKDKIPHSDDKGIYYFADHSAGVLYIGSTTRKFGYRFWPHYGEFRNTEHVTGWHTAAFFHPIVFKRTSNERYDRYIQALEAYLIATLWPPLNNKVC